MSHLELRPSELKPWVSMVNRHKKIFLEQFEQINSGYGEIFCYEVEILSEKEDSIRVRHSVLFLILDCFETAYCKKDFTSM
jgi:hypothetical protein